MKQKSDKPIIDLENEEMLYKTNQVPDVIEALTGRRISVSNIRYHIYEAQDLKPSRDYGTVFLFTLHDIKEFVKHIKGVGRPATRPGKTHIPKPPAPNASKTSK